ncbi:hypothetical protein Tco_1433230, partial [Tanacetum coccineum]
MSITNNTMQTQTSNAPHNDTVSSCSISKVQEKTQLSKEGCMKSLKALQSQFTFLTDTLKDFELRERIHKYTAFDAQSFKDTMIHDMDSIEKYMLEIILHQQETQQLKENSNSETALIKSVKDCILDSETKDVHAIKNKMSKAKERCMTYFHSLHSHLRVLSNEDLKGTRIEHGFTRAFMSLFGQDDDTFTSTMFLNVDQLQKKLDKDEFQEDVSMAAFWMFRDMLLQHMGNVKKSVAERTRHQRQYDRRVNKRQMQTNGTESEVQDDNSRSGNDTDANDTDIRPIYDEEPMAE